MNNYFLFRLNARPVVAGLMLVSLLLTWNTTLAQSGESASSKMKMESIPTYAENVAPILNEKCASCHNSGGIGPMSLLSYAEVKPWRNRAR